MVTMNDTFSISAFALYEYVPSVRTMHQCNVAVQLALLCTAHTHTHSHTNKR